MYNFSFKPARLVYMGGGMDALFGGGSIKSERTKSNEAQGQKEKQDFTSVDKTTIAFIKHLYADKKFNYFFKTLRRSATEQRKYVQDFIIRRFKINPSKQRRKLAKIIRGMYKIIGSSRKFDRLQKIALASLTIDQKSATFKQKFKIPYSNVRLTTNVGLNKRVGAYINSLVAKRSPKGAIYQALDSIGKAVIKQSNFNWEQVRISINKRLKPYGFYIHSLTAKQNELKTFGRKGRVSEKHYKLNFDAKIVCYNYGLAKKTLSDNRKKRKLESNVKSYASTKVASSNKRVS